MITVTADHFGYDVKRVVMDWLSANAHEFQELGSTSESDEQSIADFIPNVARAVLQDPTNRVERSCNQSRCSILRD